MKSKFRAVNQLKARHWALAVGLLIVVFAGMVVWSRPAWIDTTGRLQWQFQMRCTDRLDAASAREKNSHAWIVRMMMEEAPTVFKTRGWEFRVSIVPQSDELLKSGPEAGVHLRADGWVVLGVGPCDPAFRPTGASEDDWPSVSRVLWIRPASVFAKLHSAIFDTEIPEALKSERMSIEIPEESAR
ncbi:MAG: hypothetical protein ACYTEG_00205 [Planctomycetota bacterium]